MKVIEVRNEHQGPDPDRRGATAFDAGSAAAGCGLGCIREIIWIGLLLLVGYLLLATCTSMV